MKLFGKRNINNVNHAKLTNDNQAKLTNDNQVLTVGQAIDKYPSCRVLFVPQGNYNGTVYAISDMSDQGYEDLFKIQESLQKKDIDAEILSISYKNAASNEPSEDFTFDNW